ncbi:MAG: mechanosensitive ion channel family protein [Planctomycetes bacterium]|nr:mechanosensitive ion channel family protein [Planctomycetota bacterium]
MATPATTQPDLLVAPAATIAKWQETLIEFAITYGLQIVGAIVIAVVGFILASWLGRMVDGWLVKKHIEQPLRTLAVRITRIIVLAIVGVMALQKFGVEVLPIIAGMGVIGVGIGLAMQGVLANVVAGLTIIFTKPFRLGEYIDVQGEYGEVVQIELFSTTLQHADLSKIIIPNRKIVGEILHNYGTIRQLDLSVPIAYGSDLDRVTAVIKSILDAHPSVLKNPAAQIGVSSLEESAVIVFVHPWVPVPLYGPITAELYQQIAERFRAERIVIPFPQREVRMLAAAGSTGAQA